MLAHFALSDNMVDGNKLELDAIGKIIESSVKLDEHQIQREQMAHNHMATAGDLAVKHNKMLTDAITKINTSKSSQGNGQSSAATSTTAP